MNDVGETGYDYNRAGLEVTNHPLGRLLPLFWLAAYLPMALFLIIGPFLE